MSLDFYSLLEQLDEANRRAMMTHEDPYEDKKEVLSPKVGDWVIYNPQKFFGKGKSFRPMMQTMLRVNKKTLDGNLEVAQHAPAEGRQGRKTVVDVAELNDGTFKFVAQGETMPNNEKVWVRIPMGQSKLQKRFDNMFQAYRQGKIELMKKLDQDEAGEDAAEVGMKASIYDDPDQQQQAARKATLQVADRKKAANFAAQRKGLIKPQFDPGEDDDFYKRKVMAQPAAQGPAADALDQRVNAFKQQQPRQSVPADDLWQKLIQTHAAPSSTDTDADARWQQAMQANAGTINIEPLPTSQRPFAAQGAPMPLRKAECFQYRGTKLIGESRKHYAYFPVNENVEPRRYR
jgi:hypothetical protein